MHNLDVRQELVLHTAEAGEVARIVFGNGATYRTVPITDEVDRAAIATDYANSLRFVGILGVIDGRPACELRPDAGADDLEGIRHAAVAFSSEFYRRRCGDELDWLRDLLALPDTRTPNAQKAIG